MHTKQRDDPYSGKVALYETDDRKIIALVILPARRAQKEIPLSFLEDTTRLKPGGPDTKIEGITATRPKKPSWRTEDTGLIRFYCRFGGESATMRFSRKGLLRILAACKQNVDFQ